jgi:hypothetical protein
MRRAAAGLSSSCLGQFWKAEVGHFSRAPKGFRDVAASVGSIVRKEQLPISPDNGHPWSEPISGLVVLWAVLAGNRLSAGLRDLWVGQFPVYRRLSASGDARRTTCGFIRNPRRPGGTRESAPFTIRAHTRQCFGGSTHGCFFGACGSSPLPRAFRVSV